MTCSSCSARIEKKLNRMPGVEATVNFATEKAKVTFADDVTLDDLVATVEATGYTAARPPRARARRCRGDATPRRRRPASREPSTPCASGSSVTAALDRPGDPARDGPGAAVRLLAVARR